MAVRDKKNTPNLCPHCEGYTQCKCATCGVKKDNSDDREYAICTICKGLGTLPEKK